MRYKLVLIRYGELTLKSRTTRKQFENCLIKNMKQALNKYDISYSLEKEWGRLYVYTNQINKSTSVLQKIFGITSISPAVETQGEIDSISETCVTISKQLIQKGNSFAIRARRTGIHEFTSQDIAARIGNDIVNATQASVNLTTPDIEIFIDVRYERAFIFTKKIRGMGGLPVGTQGIVLAVITSPKSLLATWYIMRRGCEVVFAVTKNVYIPCIQSFLEHWYGSGDIISVTQENTIFYKRLNEIIKDKKCDAVVVELSLYDGKSKLLVAAKEFIKYIQCPVLYPLLSMNNEVIRRKCLEIGVTP